MEDQTPELTDDQIHAVLTAADIRLRAFLGLIARVGLSPRQALSLRREDVKLDEYPPRIRISQAYHACRGEIPRTVEIDCDLADSLRDHLHSAHHLTATAPLFPSHNGSPLTTRWAQRVVAALCRGLGFGSLKLRDLRGAAIRGKLDSGVPLPEIQRQLGLSDVTFPHFVYPSTRRRHRNRSARPTARLGRPRKTDRDAELVRMMQQQDATYAKVALDYNRLHPPETPEKRLKPEAVRKAVTRHLRERSKP